MRELFKALIAPKIKTVYILVLTAVIVMMSIHTNSSINGAELEIIRKLDANNAPHASVILLESISDPKDLETMLGVLDSFEDKGVHYASDEYTYLEQNLASYVTLLPGSFGNYPNQSYPNSNVLIAEPDSNEGGRYQVVSGKKINELTDHEVAIPVNTLEHFGFTYEEALGKTITVTQQRSIYSKVLRGEDPKLTVEYCVIFEEEGCYKNVSKVIDVESELTIASLTQKIGDKMSDDKFEFNPGIEFFKPDEDNQTMFFFMTEGTRETIFEGLIAANDEINTFFLSTIDDLPYDVFSSKERREEILNDDDFILNVDHRSTEQVVNIRFDRYSRELENELAEAIGKINVSVDNQRRSGFRLDTLASKLDKQPMVTSVLQVLSTYVLMGVLLSSFYSFYIHFRNQIRTSTKEISALLMQGISWNKVVGVYLLELGLIFIISVGVFGLVSLVLHGLKMSDVLYASQMRIHAKTLLYGLLYFLGLSLIIILSLSPFKKDILMKFKKASQTQLSFVSLSSKNMIKTLSLKRVFKYIASTIGFAFSISLVSAIIVLSVSSSNHLKNLYSKDTFGIQFDYMIRFTDEARERDEIYALTQEFAETQAPIYKVPDIIFMDHSLWGGNSNFYRSSEIVFVNEIEAFVPLQEGTYPPHWTQIKGDPPPYKKEALVSRRHLDKRDIKKSDKKVENSYLFYYESEDSFYESAYHIYGSVNALYNNGWVLSGYAPRYVSPGELVKVETGQYVLNLKADTDIEAFETMLDSQNIEFLRYDMLIDDFQAMNNAMNQTALLISLTVTVLMLVLLSINIGGLILSVKMEIKDDDSLLTQLGIAKGTLTRVNTSVMILRVMLSFIFLLLLIGIIYPFYFESLLSAFGLFSMPGSILVPFILGTLGLNVILFTSYFFINKIKTPVSEK